MNLNFTFKSFLLIFLSGLYSITINVPGDYTTIQEALDVADDGDIVLVGDGTYTENLIIESEITLTSTGGHQNTTIDGSNPADNMGSTITIRPESGSAIIPQNIEISGFTITGGIGNLMDREVDSTRTIITTRVGGGIMVYNASPKIKNNNIKENGTSSTGNGGGIIAVDSAEDWSFNDREWELNPELPPVTNDLDFSENIFYGNEAISAKTLFVDGFEELSTNLSNSTFDCYSSDYQDVSEYWVKGELTEFNYEGSDGIEFIYTDVWVNPETGIDEGNTIGDIDTPFQTIDFAMGMIYATETHPITIYLAAGIYSPETGESFPINMYSYLDLVGEGEGITVLNAEQTGRVIVMSNCVHNTISGITLTGGETPTGTSWEDSYFASGAGMYLYFSNPTLHNITITENEAGLTGGGMYLIGSDPTLSNVLISNNDASSGGGMCLEGSNPTLLNMRINLNTALTEGGGMYVIDSDATLINVTIANNSSYSGGGIGISADSSPSLINVLIIGNIATHNGGGINISYYSSPTMTNVTIAGNSAEEWGGGIFVSGSSTTLINTIVWDNGLEPIYEPSSMNESMVITYSDIEGGWEGEWFADENNNGVWDSGEELADENNNGVWDSGVGNMDIDPFFNDDFTLQGHSPCINMGNPNSWYSDIDLTIADMGFTGGLFILPGFTSHDFGEVGNLGSSKQFTLFNYRDTSITIDEVIFESSSFSSNTSFPITIGSLETGIINIQSNNQIFGTIQDSMTLISNNLPEGISISLSVTGVDGNILTGNLSGTYPPEVYRISGDISVVSGDTLILQPGTEFLFDGSYKFTLEGVLKAEGTVEDSIIFKNYADENWVGFDLYHVNDETIFDYVHISGASWNFYVEENSWYGGGMYLYFSNPTLTNVLISKNEAPFGGGMYLYSSNPTLTNVLISGNEALYGGGLHLQASNPILTNVTIMSNIVEVDGGSGSPLGGGMYLHSSNPILMNVLISDNSSGGGMYLEFSNPTLINAIISDLVLGMYLKYSDPTLINTIIWDQGINDWFNSIMSYDNDDNPVIIYSDIKGGWEGEENINEDPQFNTDFTLQSTSPCINAGTADIDGDGQPDITDYVGSAPDMGVYEYIPNQQNGDLNGDGSVNIIDIVALVNIILNDLDTEGADFNGDGTVNVIDVVGLVQFVLNN